MLFRRLSSHRWLLSAAALWGAIAAAGPAVAAPLLKVQDVAVGWQGKYTAGNWTRIRLTIVAPQAVRGTLRLIVPDGDGVPVEFGKEQPAIDFAQNEPQTLERYFQAGSIRSTITAVFDSEDGGTWREVLAVPSPLAATQSLVLTLGPELGVKQALQNRRRRKDESIVDLTITNADDLPRDWFAYQSVEAVILPTGADSLEPSLRPEQLAALKEWVAQGGRLILSAGSRAEQLLGPDGRLHDLIPGEFDKTTPLTRTVGLEKITGAPLSLQDAFGREGLPVVQLKNFVGAIELREGAGTPPNRPLIIRSSYRFGQVVFVAFDCDHPGLRNWAGQPGLMAALLQAGKREGADVAEESHGQVTELGYTDLAGQLRVGLEQFSSVTFVDFTSIAVLIFLYLALIGPVDYFLLDRLGLPKHLTWLTFPVVTMAFIAAGIYLAQQAHGTSVRVTQAEVVDVDAESGFIRGAHWTHLYSPETQLFDLKSALNSDLNTTAELRGGWLGWQGLPGKGVGGLGATQTAPVVVAPYQEQSPGPAPAIENLPVQTASSKALAGRWWGKSSVSDEKTLTVDAYGALRGELTNPLPVELLDARLMYEGWVYFLPNPVAPGAKVDLRSMRYFSLEARLTQRKTQGDKDVSTPWDPQLTDVGQIMPMLLFHGAARGDAYTGLSHRYQSYLDLSEHLTTGRAILVGRTQNRLLQVERSSVPFTDENYDQSWTWWRVILPVQGIARP